MDAIDEIQPLDFTDLEDPLLGRHRIHKSPLGYLSNFP